MQPYFRAVAIDYDGTLTAHDTPSPDVLAALREARERGLHLVLVTGRILAELRAVFPSCAEHVDLIVAENGGVLAAGSLAMPLGLPVPAVLDGALRRLGAPFRRGEVIVATSAAYELPILHEVQLVAPDCQLVRNRGELMIVPAGISKASGLRYALLQLGVSPHSTLAIGDAENDLAMLESCEVGVAVANAVDAVKARADAVLAEEDGAGVAALLRGTLVEGGPTIQPSRWQITLGRSPSGEAVRIPASAIDVVIAGGTGSGKSFAAGLIAEQLVQLGYVVCVFDPEGDHAPLGRLPNVVTLGGRNRMPSVEDLSHIFEQSGTSVVVDLSLVPAHIAQGWTTHAIEFLESRRLASGVPHWLVIDEAHNAQARAAAQPAARRVRGHCLVTYRPAQLAELSGNGVDYAVLVAGEHGVDIPSVQAVTDAAGIPRAQVLPLLADLQAGEALLVRCSHPAAVERVTFAPRWVPHVRHWHKYASAHLPVPRRFYFRSPAGLTGAVAGNMEEFHHELRCASADTILQHARGGDFSRWARDVLKDLALATAFELSEQRLRAAREPGELEAARRELLTAIERRYASVGSWPIRACL